jgi:multidrug efflux system membrane fusion protein
MDQHIKDPSIVAPGPVRRASRWPGFLTGCLVLAVLAGIVWWTRQQAAPPQAGGGRNAGPMSIVPETIGKGDIGVSLNALGTVTSLATVTIRSQISGYLMKISFKEGDEVKKGDPIAEIDSRTYEATLAQAKGTLARDEAQLKGAQVDLTRYQNLATQNAVPHQTLDTQVALVAQYQGTVEADRAAVKSAEVNLAYCHIVSPINGRVGLRQVDLGNYVTPGDTNGLVVITQLEPISVLFTLPEDNLQAVKKRLKEGAVMPTAAYDRSGANKLADGSLQTFDSQIDPTTGTIKLRAQFENEGRTLYPNQFVNIRLLLDTHKDATTMSTAGIQRGVPGTFVYLVNADSTVSVRPAIAS